MAVAGTGGRQLSHGVRDRRRSCKSQTPRPGPGRKGASARRSALFAHPHLLPADEGDAAGHAELLAAFEQFDLRLVGLALGRIEHGAAVPLVAVLRSEEHTTELQSLMRISSAVFCLKKQTNPRRTINTETHKTNT